MKLFVVLAQILALFRLTYFLLLSSTPIPALVLLGGIPMKEAIGTSLLIITFKSATGFLGYLNQVTIDWNLMLTFTTVAILGVIWGAYFSGKIRSEKLQQGFGYFLIAIATFILIRR